MHSGDASQYRMPVIKFGRTTGFKEGTVGQSRESAPDVGLVRRQRNPRSTSTLRKTVLYLRTLTACTFKTVEIHDLLSLARGALSWNDPLRKPLRQA